MRAVFNALSKFPCETRGAKFNIELVKEMAEYIGEVI